MHDVLSSRRGPGPRIRGLDKMLTAVAVTVLSLSATAATAQSSKTPAELAIDAAIPFPEPANVPPPTAADIKQPDTTASVPDTAPKIEPKADTAVKQDEPAPKKDEAVTPAAAPVNTATTPPTAPATAAAPATPAPATAAAPAAPEASPAPATAATPAAEPAPAVASLNQTVADKIRDLIAAKGTRYFDRKAERIAVDNFYKARAYAPLWSEEGTLTARGKSVAARLKDAAADGLDPDDYPVPDFSAGGGADGLAESELKLTASMLDYARHAQSGRMHWSQVSGDISYPEHPVDPAEVLVNISTAKDASAALEGYNPQHKGYQALKAKLAMLRGVTDDTSKHITEGETLKFVKPTKKNPNPEIAEDDRVPALRAKLEVTGGADDKHYDAAISAAVRTFQAQNDLKPTGNLDNATVRALNGPRNDRKIDIVRVNMERWRWLPRQLGAASLGDAYVILNIPDFTLKVMQHGKQVWTTRVVTGKPGVHATPLLSETMKFITVNPTWNVPPSIVYNEYLPALQQDPDVLTRMGLKLERRPDGTIHISQPPGEGNALGRIRFNFPNKFLVYQHDTPDKYLFAKDVRAFSHGCMRVQNPEQYAATLLGITQPKDNYTPEKIRSMYGSSEVNINFPTPIPVNITYQTAFVDEAGKLEFRKDIYGRDATMISMLKGANGKDLEAVVSHAQPNYVRPANVNIPSAAPTYTADNGMNFFERLFGAPAAPPPAPVRPQQRRIFR